MSRIHVPEKSGLPKAKADPEKVKVMSAMKTATRFINTSKLKLLKNIADGNIHVNSYLLGVLCVLTVSMFLSVILNNFSFQYLFGKEAN